MRNNRKKQQEKHKNLLYFILTLGISLLISKYYKRQPKNKGANSSNILDNLGIKASDMPRLINIAKNVAHNLGTAYGKLDPRNWTENDQQVFNDMVLIQSQFEFQAVAKLYTEEYAKSHDLSVDLKKHLDDNLYQKLLYK